MSSSLLNSSQFWWPTVSRILICMFAVILEGGGGEGCGLKRLGKFGCFGLESLMGGGILQWDFLYSFVFVLSENESLLAPFKKQVCV